MSLNESFHKNLESIQYNAAVAIIGAIRGIPSEKVYSVQCAEPVSILELASVPILRIYDLHFHMRDAVNISEYLFQTSSGVLSIGIYADMRKTPTCLL